eukprot:8155315-Ditylum_brightwellii.AAC.1
MIDRDDILEKVACEMSISLDVAGEDEIVTMSSSNDNYDVDINNPPGSNKNHVMVTKFKVLSLIGNVDMKFIVITLSAPGENETTICQRGYWGTRT